MSTEKQHTSNWAVDLEIYEVDTERTLLFESIYIQASNEIDLLSSLTERVVLWASNNGYSYDDLDYEANYDLD